MPPTPDPAYVASLEATSEGGNTFKTTFHGPASGITDEVWFWTPRGYSATDGKSYNVLTLLHGVPGTADGIVPGLDLGTQLQAAIDDGRLPPTIVAVPSLNADAAQRSSPDCADIIGRAKVGTWIQEDLPRMVRATFPNARTDRLGWALGGFSSGGFCATWTTIMRSDVYSTVMNLSGIDTMNVGALSTPELREENTVSRMLGSQPHQPIRIWAMAAQDDPIAHQAMVALAQAPRGPGDVVDLIEPETGGHGTALWKEQLSEFFSWWGVQPEAWGPGVRQSPAPEATSQATATATSSEPAADAQAADEPAERPAQPQRPHLLATFTGIRGAGTIGLFFLLTVALSVCCLLVRLPGLARLRGLRAGAQPGLRTGSGADEQPVRAVPAAEAGTAGRTVARRLLGWAGALSARGLPLLAACLCFALLVGLIGNRLGGFYPTWAVAWENLRPAF